MTKRTRWLFTLGAILLAVLVVLGLRGEAQTVDVAEVAHAPLTVTTQEEGKTRLRERWLVSAPIPGQLRRIALEQGDTVSAGQLVAEIEPLAANLLDPATRERIEAEARAASDAQRATVQHVRAARAARDFAQSERERFEAMPEGSAISRSQLEGAQARALQAEAEYAAARAEQASAVERERAARALLEQQGERGGPMRLPLLAPVDGVLIRRFQESSATVAAGQPLLEFGDPAAIEIEVEALSTEAVKLRPHMRARVLRWGGGSELEAAVTRIEPGGFTKVSALGVEEQRVRVILDLVSPREEWMALGDAYRVEVEFILWEDANVLQVPSSALFRDGDAWQVFVDDAGVARMRAVQIGARGSFATQVIDGLEPGERVVTHPDDRIADGVRLKPRG